MDLKLEVLIVPVTDLDRAKQFYQKLGFRLDVDYTANEDYRIMQFTPPGSEASIILGKGVTSAPPGSIDRLILAVSDIEAVRQTLVSNGVDVSEVFHDASGGLGGGFHPGTEARAAGPDPQHRSYGSYASFRDPDGNVWLLQEIQERLPGRATQQPVNGRTTEILLDALKNAAIAHGAHEKELGKADPDWPEWYARHMTHALAEARYNLIGPSKNGC